MTATAWGVYGGRNRRLLEVRRQAASIAALALSLLSGGTVLQMSGICAAMLALNFDLCDALQRVNSMVWLVRFNCKSRYRGF